MKTSHFVIDCSACQETLDVGPTAALQCLTIVSQNEPFGTQFPDFVPPTSLTSWDGCCLAMETIKKKKKIKHPTTSSALYAGMSACCVHPQTQGQCRFIIRLDPCVKLQAVLHELRCSQLALELINVLPRIFSTLRQMLSGLDSGLELSFFFDWSWGFCGCYPLFSPADDRYCCHYHYFCNCSSELHKCSLSFYLQPGIFHHGDTFSNEACNAALSEWKNRVLESKLHIWPQLRS